MKHVKNSSIQSLLKEQYILSNTRLELQKRLRLFYSMQYFRKDEKFGSFDKVNEACQEFFNSKPAEGTIHIKQNSVRITKGYGLFIKCNTF